MSNHLKENEYDELFQTVAKCAEQKEGLDTLIDSFSLIPVDAPAYLTKEPQIAVQVEGLRKGEKYWNAKEMTIDVRFNTKIEERSRFDVYLTFGSRKPASKDCVVVLRKGQIGKLHLNLEARGLYTASDYILQLKHNNNPYLEFPFNVNEKGEVSEGKVVILNKNSMASYLMGSDLDFSEGKKLMALCGCQEVKKLAANFVLQKRINDLRKDLLLPSLWNLNFVLYDNGKQDYDDLSSYLGRIIYGDNVEQDDIDLTDEDWREDKPGIRASEWGVHHCVRVTGFSALMGADAIDDVNDLLRYVEHCKTCGKDLIVFQGEELELERFFKKYPQFKKYFPKQNRVHANGETVSELISMVFESIEMNGFVCLPDCQTKLLVGLKKAWEVKSVKSLDDGDIKDFVSNYILDNQCQRLMQDNKCLKVSKDMSLVMMKTLEANDVDLSYFDNEKDDFEVSMNHLNGLVGLSELKQNLRDFFLQTRFEIQRKQLGLTSLFENRHHMLFTGNPGTGKTTVAMLMGKLFHSMGLLSKGDVVKVDRPSLVGEFIGQTEKNVSNILKRARGNVLFVDEAYALFADKDDSRDYGRRVVESLLTVLAEPDPDMLIIFAGYKDDMERLMSMNDGLKGRFPHEFHFSDFNADELTLIGKNLLEKNGYELPSDTEACLKNVVGQMLSKKNKKFANARWITDFVNVGILKFMARRVTSIAKPQKADYQQVRKEDVLNAWQELCQKSAEKPNGKRIGFVA